MEDTVITHNTKISDSGYSNSCSNSQSQRSGSSKSRHSGSSSGSSGYCGHPSTLGSSNDSSFQRPSTSKRKDYKKKKLKAVSGELLNDSSGVPVIGPATPLETNAVPPTGNNNMIIESTETTGTVQNTEKEHIQINTLARPALSLDTNKKTKGNEITNAGEEASEAVDTPVSADLLKCEKKTVDEPKSFSSREEFSAVVSMQEGVVLYTTSSLTDILGYPKDMWLGRSLIDFIHPKDRAAFSEHITAGIATPLTERQCQNGKSSMKLASKRPSSTFYCCLRQYRGLKSTGFEIMGKKVSYLPCRLTFNFREITTNQTTSLPERNVSSPMQLLLVQEEPLQPQKQQTHRPDIGVGSQGGSGVHAILLVIIAQPIRSAYKDPEEICESQTFATQHSTSMNLTHVDPEVVSYFGYLPQDMLKRSVFDFYHPEDMPYLKEVYRNVFKEKRQPFHSKPIRFRTQNGTYAYIETEWSSFINPWTKKLEFVIGQHRVIKGPLQPDVTTPVSEPEALQVSEEIIKESNAIKEEILNLLNETAQTSDASKRQMSNYCKELLTFMEHFLDDEKANAEKACNRNPVPLSIFDRDSMMLGEISPHHEYCDSKSSSETPPSYTQLNYNDNIQRFFQSKPKTTLSIESSDSKTGLDPGRNKLQSTADGKTSPVIESSFESSHNRNSCLNESGGSSDLSFTSTNAESSDNKSANPYRTPHLTEALLSKHNENMEKKMVQKHRERSKSDRENKLKDSRQKKTYDKVLEEQGTHGVKRSGSHSWEGEPFKSIKQTHTELTAAVSSAAAAAAAASATTAGRYTMETGGGSVPNQPASMQTTNNVFSKSAAVSVTTNVNLWPPFSVTVTPMHTSQHCSTHLSYTAAPLPNPMMPFYYVPTADLPGNHSGLNSEQLDSSVPPYIHAQPSYLAGQVQCVRSMMYHPFAMPMLCGTPPVMYSPLTMLPAPLLPTQPMKPCSDHNNTPLDQALSETSKREGKSLYTSPQRLMTQDSPKLIQQKRKNSADNSNDILENTLQNDSSSYYSSFYSYLKSDEKSNESMKSLTENESSGDATTENKREGAWRRAFGNTNSEVPCPNMESQIKKDPPWLEDVILTPDLIFRYKVNEKVLSEVLESDLKLLAEINQPITVNEQLCQLYLDLDSFSQPDCSIETSIGLASSSTSSGEGDDSSITIKMRKKHRSMKYDKMVMLFEENAPLPPPLQNGPLPQQLPCASTSA